MSEHDEPVRLTPATLAASIPSADGERFAVGLSRGQLTVELYIPQGEDLQSPHDRDECYVIIEGAGRFRCGDRTVAFEPGDFLFVPAGVEHRFVDFGRSLKTWVIFYGPEGGDRAG